MADAVARVLRGAGRVVARAAQVVAAVLIGADGRPLPPAPGSPPPEEYRP